MSDEECSTTALSMQESIRRGLLPERLGVVGRLCTSMCYQLATEYRFREALSEIPKLTDTALASFDEILDRSLSKRFSEMTLSFCQERFQEAHDTSSSLMKILNTMKRSNDFSYKDYVHPRSIDEMNTLADAIIFTNQSSGWILGKHPKNSVQVDLPDLLENLRIFENELESREIPAWLYFLSKLYARVMIRYTDYLSVHTAFHRYAEACRTALDFIRQGYTTLWPTQVEPIVAALQEKDILLTAETGTGKSLLGAIMIASKSEKRGLSIYTVPTRALAHQVSERIVKLAYGGMPENVRVLTMEDEVKPEELRICKTLVGTYEKIEGLFRENIVSPNSVNMFVVDECHNISDFNRGVTLDFLLSQMNPRFHCQRVLLSAVIPTDEGKRFAQWAKTEYIMGKDWRRTQLQEKIAFGSKEVLLPKEADDEAIARIIQIIKDHGSDRIKVEELVKVKTVELARQGKVVLVTAETRRKVEQLAEQIAGAITALTTYSLFPDIGLRDRIDENKDQVFQYINRLKSSELVPPKSIESILRLLTRRVVYHHAGLPKKLRRTIEDMIENRIPLVIVSTSTLEAGVNFPIDVAILKRLVLTKRMKTLKAKMENRGPFWSYTISRYESMLFSTYRNTIGRAGRAGFAEKGESVFFVDTLEDAKAFLDMRYRKSRTLGEGADMYVLSRFAELSQLDYDRQLGPISRDLNQSRGRFLSNLLQVISSSGGHIEEILSILKKTWLWRTVCESSPMDSIEERFSALISNELDQLVNMGFVRSDQKRYQLTPLGLFVNLSLISPTSAYRMTGCLRSVKASLSAMHESDIDYSILNAVGMAYEVRTSPFDRHRKLQAQFTLDLKSRLKSLGVFFDDCSVQLAAVLYRWMKGHFVDDIIQEFKLDAADHGLLEEMLPKNALWVLRCVKSLSKGIGCPTNLVSRIDEITSFVSMGTDNKIVADLINMQVPGIGRNSALFLVDKFRPSSLSAFSRLNESKFKKEFPGKEKESARILEQLVKRLS